jgi:DMSO/TMAO reductase YedYZ molybdopterin-dependent catalytic subunit
MKKTNKVALIAVILLIGAFFPLYYLTHSGVQENTLLVRGNVKNPLALTLSQLKNYEPTTLHVNLTSSGKSQENGVYNYTGVLLKDLLNQAQLNDTATSVFVQASDGYGTTLTIQEATSENTILAYQKGDVPINSLTDSGEGLRLIVGNDTYAQRWIRNVVNIEIT